MIKQAMDKLARKLGYMSQEEHEKFRIQCRDWAMQNLNADGLTVRATPSSARLDTDFSVYIIGDDVEFDFLGANKVHVAPWCNGAHLSKIIALGNQECSDYSGHGMVVPKGYSLVEE